MNEKKLTLALLALLERENAVSIPQISAMLGADEQTIWNLLEELVFAYDAVSLRLELEEAHATLFRDGTSRLFRLNEAETDVLLDVLEKEGIDSQSELSQKLVSAKGLFAHTNSAPVSKMRTLGTQVSADIALALAQACEDEEHHMLEIEYLKDGDAECETRVVEPHAIRSDEFRTYLEAYDAKREGWRSFRVDRVRSVSTLRDTFSPRTLPEDTKLSSRKRAVVRFAPGVPVPQDWSGLRKLHELEDGATEVSIPWYFSKWLPKKIVGMLGKAVPVSPPELVEACESYARQLLEK